MKQNESADRVRSNRSRSKTMALNTNQLVNTVLTSLRFNGMVIRLSSFMTQRRCNSLHEARMDKPVTLGWVYRDWACNDGLGDKHAHKLGIDELGDDLTLLAVRAVLSDNFAANWRWAARNST